MAEATGARPEGDAGPGAGFVGAWGVQCTFHRRNLSGQPEAAPPPHPMDPRRRVTLLPPLPEHTFQEIAII